MSIRWQFSLPIAVILIVGLIGMAVSAFLSSRSAVEQTATQQLAHAANGFSTSASGWFADRQMDVKSWASDAGYRKALETSFVGKAARRAANGTLAQTATSYGFYQRMFIVDPKGVVIAASQEDLIDKKAALPEDLMAKALEGQVVMSDGLRDDVTGNPVVMVLGGMRDGKDEKVVAGVFGAVVSLEYFAARFADTLKVGESGRVLVFNAEGDAIVHPDRNRLFGIKAADLFKDLSVSDGTVVHVGYQDDGIARSAAVAGLTGTGWAVVVDIADDEVGAPVRRVGLIALVVSLVILFVGGLVTFFAVGRIVGPIGALTGVMTRLAEGDTRVEIKGAGRHDEIGAMAKAVQVFKDNAIEKEHLEAEQAARERQAEEEKRQTVKRMADDFEASIGSVVNKVSSASTDLEHSAEIMNATAGDAVRQAATVAAAAEEASANVETVASAAEELSSSISEIGRQVGQASSIASDAVRQANDTNAKILSLADAVQKIGEVVNLITAIAEQTNLLALNATIEAARAGDAGKGFAVVASEVKNLANQTAKATEEIAAQISGVQASTTEAVTAIETITKTIEEVDQIAAAIAAAVEQQSAATQEIARNVEQASVGTHEVSANIQGVNDAAETTGSAASQISDAARLLSQQSETLQGEVGQFLSRVRAG